MNRVRLRNLFFVSAAFLVLLGGSPFLVGCSSQTDKVPPGGACTASKDCQEGYECRLKKCRTPLVNTKPVAVLRIDPESGAKVGDKVLAIGEKSRDKEGDLLTYKWSLGKPAKSKVKLQDERAKRAHFTPDVAGDYTVGLIVNDGKVDSALVSITVKVEDSINTKPVANAGLDQDVLPGATVTLDGTKSIDQDGDKLEYLWTLKSSPKGSSAKLSHRDKSKPTFVADTAGDYIISLVVTDERNAKSQEDTVTIHAIVGLDKTPKITKVNPTEAVAQSLVDVTVDGQDFVHGAVILLGSKSFPATFKSDKQLTAKLDLNGVTPGKNELKVSNPNRKDSNAIEFLVKPIPVPELAKLEPAAAPINSNIQLKVLGKNFISKSVVYFGTTPLPTTYVSETELKATLNLQGTSEISYKVTVRSPGGINSKNDLSFRVTPPLAPPKLNVLNPPQGTENKKITFSVHGQGFEVGAVIYFNNKPLPTKRIRRDELQADPSLDLKGVAPGYYDVYVQNIDGQKSNVEKFYVDGINPTPVLTRVLPFLVYIGEKTTLSVFGRSISPQAKFFIDKKEFPINAKRRSNTFFEAVFDDTTKKWPKAGDYDAYIENPGGKKSKTFVITITHPTPSVDSITPTAWSIGCDVDITIKGRLFVSSSIVKFGAATYSQTATDPKFKLTRNGNTELKFKVLKTNLSQTTYKISVENGPGAASTTTDFKVHNRTGTPEISTVRPSSGRSDSIVAVTIDDVYTPSQRIIPGTYIELNGKRMPTTCDLSFSGDYCWDITAQVDLTGLAPGKVQLKMSPPCASKPSDSKTATFTVLPPSTPGIQTISPAYATVGQKTIINITGHDFAKGHQLYIDGKVVPSVWKDSDNIHTQAVYDFSAATPGSTVDIYVKHTNGKQTPTVKYSILAASPTLTITKLGDDKYDRGEIHKDVAINGTGFTTNSELYMAGTKITATYVSTTQLNIASLDLTSAKQGIRLLQVKDGAKSSNFYPLYVSSPPAPIIDYLSPASRIKGASTSTSLTIYGQGFCPKSTSFYCGTKPTVKVTGPKKTDYSSNHSTSTARNTYLSGDFRYTKLPIGDYIFRVILKGGIESNPVVFELKPTPPPEITGTGALYRGVHNQSIQVLGKNFVTGDSLIIKHPAFALRKFPGTATGSTVINFSLSLSGGYAGKVDIEVERCTDPPTCSKFERSNTWKLQLNEIPSCSNASNCASPPLGGSEGCTTYNGVQTCRPKCTKDSECKAMLLAPANAKCDAGFCK